MTVGRGAERADAVVSAADVLRRRVPRRHQQRLIEARLRLRTWSDPERRPPDFLVIGAQRSGTSSLYKWLEQHPDVVSSLRKETEYFSFRFTRGATWYLAHFPSRVRRASHQRRAGREPLTFEATPTYLFHPEAPGRAHAFVPDAKLIALLRDPVARAFSHYRHMVRYGQEPLAFEAALDREEQRLHGEVDLMAADPAYRSLPWERWSYAARGHYAEQLERWLERYPRERLLVLRSEDLFEDPASTYAKVLTFLGLDPFRPRQFQNWSVVRPDEGPLPAAAAERLDAHFAAPNRRLAELLGTDIGWAARSRG